MFEIIAKDQLGPHVTKFEIRAPRIAKARQPGQFVILRCDSFGERIPLTIADVDSQGGTITLIIQAIGYTTTTLCNMDVGQLVLDIVGPLGEPTELGDFGHAVCVGGGVGTAVIYPQAAALKKDGNYVTSIIGGRTRELVILENELKEISDRVIVCTDDGSYGIKGFVTEALTDVLTKSDKKVGAVFAAGPVPMMKAICNLTKSQEVRTIVSLNPIMIDGTGMCGGCRVTVGGQTKFACVDGPEFDGHLVDFDELTDRLTAYQKHEKQAMDSCEQPTNHQCKLDKAIKEQSK